MGTHPIFESDFDCLTEIERMKLFKTGLLMVAVVALAVNAEEEFDSEVEDGIEVEDEAEVAEEAGEGAILEADEGEEEEADDEGTGAHMLILHHISQKPKFPPEKYQKF